MATKPGQNRKIEKAQTSPPAVPEPLSSEERSLESPVWPPEAGERRELSLTAVETRLPIHSDRDIVVARMRGRELATKMGFGTTDLTLIATSISELARNIILYAKQGEIVLRVISDSARHGIEVTARDEGPGIVNPEQATQNGYSTSRGLGMGLPGVRRLMDEFAIVSEIGRGTTVTAKKWKY